MINQNMEIFNIYMITIFILLILLLVINYLKVKYIPEYVKYETYFNILGGKIDNYESSIKVGDIVEVSSKNKNHLGRDVCAYAGMKGKVVETWKDGEFCIHTGNSELVVNGGRDKRGYWIILNGREIYHRFKK